MEEQVKRSKAHPYCYIRARSKGLSETIGRGSKTERARSHSIELA